MPQPVNPVVPRTAESMIVLEYPASARGALNYTINGTPFQLTPGNSVRMRDNQVWNIGIRDKQGKLQQYKLQQAGNYKLQYADNGWYLDVKPATAAATENQKSILSTPAKPSAEINQEIEPTLNAPVPTGGVKSILEFENE